MTRQSGLHHIEIKHGTIVVFVAIDFFLIAAIVVIDVHLVFTMSRSSQYMKSQSAMVHRLAPILLLYVIINEFRVLFLIIVIVFDSFVDRGLKVEECGCIAASALSWGFHAAFLQ
jgi:hypothetical protein